MAVLHDYRCPDHGVFSGFSSECPQGCTDGVHIIFLKPVGMRSDKTRHADSTLRNLASDFGMTDIKSVREGESQAGHMLNHKEGMNREHRPGDNAIWGGAKEIMGRPTNLNVENVLGGAYKGMGVTGITAPKPQPSVIMRDHENLSIKS